MTVIGNRQLSICSEGSAGPLKVGN